jgi:two-component system cell cycle sensor histidine kinase/response regulator CckA
MSRPLRLLIVDDSQDDVCLLLRAVNAGGYDATYEVVNSASAMRAALQGQDWDLIIADHSMQRFSAPAALTLARELRPDLPIIIVSNEIDLKLIVSLIQKGATDYVSKTELVRLAPEIERVLQERYLYNDGEDNDGEELRRQN